MEMQVVTSPYPGATAPERGARYLPAAPGCGPTRLGEESEFSSSGAGKPEAWCLFSLQRDLSYCSRPTGNKLALTALEPGPPLPRQEPQCNQDPQGQQRSPSPT